MGISYIEQLVFILLLSHLCNPHVDGLVQDCSNSIANALELLQSCTKSSYKPI